MGKQPGVMLYFEIRPCLNRLTCDEQGQLFHAILNYGEFGVIPDFQGMLGIAWDFIQPRLDRDRERYEEQCMKSRYAAYTREAKKRDEIPLSFEDWRASDDIG